MILFSAYVERRRSRFGGWGLPAIVGGALLLVIIALIAVTVSWQDEPELASLATPDGVVQHFYAAVYRGDYSAAYAMLSESAQRELTLSEFQQRLRYERESELRIDAVAYHNSTATVTVTMIHFNPGGLFGGSEWTENYDILLSRDGESWRVLSGPFW